MVQGISRPGAEAFRILYLQALLNLTCNSIYTSQNSSSSHNLSGETFSHLCTKNMELYTSSHSVMLNIHLICASFKDLPEAQRRGYMAIYTPKISPSKTFYGAKMTSERLLNSFIPQKLLYPPPKKKQISGYASETYYFQSRPTVSQPILPPSVRLNYHDSLLRPWRYTNHVLTYLLIVTSPPPIILTW